MAHGVWEILAWNRLTHTLGSGVTRLGSGEGCERKFMFKHFPEEAREDIITIAYSTGDTKARLN
jgi:hypothetical protein